MTRPQLILAPGKEKAIERRHPWIFSGAVDQTVGHPHEGDTVDVVSSRGNWLAAGHYQHQSIACKVLSFETPDIDSDIFLEKRLRSAIEYREHMGFFHMDDTNVFRLVHAEGDNMPGLVCDWYNGVLVMQAHSVGMYRLFPTLSRLFAAMLAQYGLQAIFNKSSSTLPNSIEDGYLWGDEGTEKEVKEHGCRILVNLFEGQKTGFFIDQRENRSLVKTLAKGHHVLNCFGYTGGFSLAALAGDATMVETVDISKRAIDMCNRNVNINFGTAAPHVGVVADVVRHLDATDHRFDFIILDPPAFAKNHRSLQQGLRGYRSINQRAMEALPAGGLLMTFSCSQAVSADDFQTMIFTAAMNAGKRVRIVRRLTHAPDHPVSIHHPEGEYLKGLLLQIE
ncbi:MAG: class I SAM-dependent rRNA methyltransferase [Bacteroidales bacterium]|nr:class I SAM-dependent rRNA methyltransferase [Bacteroidales bacterium]